MINILLMASIYIILPYSEFYEASKWNCDPRFQAPMITLHNGTSVFVGDIVTVEDLCYGKIKKFMVEVCRYCCI